jgi:hypothetical protein
VGTNQALVPIQRPKCKSLVKVIGKDANTNVALRRGTRGFKLDELLFASAWGGFGTGKTICIRFSLLASKALPTSLGVPVKMISIHKCCVFFSHLLSAHTQVVKKAKLTKVVFNPKWPIILVGDDKGVVTCLKLSPNLRKQALPKHGQKVSAAKTK